MANKFNKFLFFLGTILLSGCQNVATIQPIPVATCETVVTLGPTITELLLAMGAEKRIVAVSRYDKLPAGVVRPKVGGLLDPEVEAIAALRPSCVLYVPTGAAVAEKLVPLTNLGIKTVPVEVASIAEMTTAIDLLGNLMNLPTAANDLKKRLEQSKSSLRGKEYLPLKVVILYDVHPLVAAGPGSLGDELLAFTGWQNPVTGPAYPVLDEEILVAMAPDLVIDLSAKEQIAELRKILPQETIIKNPDEDALRHPSPGSLSKWLEFIDNYYNK